MVIPLPMGTGSMDLDVNSRRSIVEHTHLIWWQRGFGVTTMSWSLRMGVRKQWFAQHIKNVSQPIYPSNEYGVLVCLGSPFYPERRPYMLISSWSGNIGTATAALLLSSLTPFFCGFLLSSLHFLPLKISFPFLPWVIFHVSVWREDLHNWA